MHKDQSIPDFVAQALLRGLDVIKVGREVNTLARQLHLAR